MRTFGPAASAADRVGKKPSAETINRISLNLIEGLGAHSRAGLYRQSRVDLGSIQIWNECGEQYDPQLLVLAQLLRGEPLKKPSSSPVATSQIRGFSNQVNPLSAVPFERLPINGRLST
jgi:hypothetical protein